MNETDQLIADLSRDMVGAIAPSELPMFRANSAAYFADPERALKPASAKDEMLGFGVAEAALFLTPVILAAVRAVVDFAIKEFGKSARAEGEAVIAGWVRSLFKAIKATPSPAATPPAAGAPLSREQLQRLRQIALDKALQYLDETQASRLADELVGRIATA